MEREHSLRVWLGTGLIAAIFLGPLLGVLVSGERTGMRNGQYAVLLALLATTTGARQRGLWRASFPPATWIFLAGLSLAFFWLVSFLRFHAVELNGVDFSIFDWMLASSWQGRFMYSPIYDVQHLGVHPSWVMIVLIPLHALVASPYLLLSLGPLVVWLAIFPLAELAGRHRLTEADTGLLILAYLTSSFVGVLITDGFRIESFFPWFTFAFLAAWERRSPVATALWALLVLAVKEDAALYLGAFGAFHLLKRGERGRALLLLTASLGVLFVNLAIAQPYFLAARSGQGPSYLKFWGHWGPDKSSILRAMAADPLRVLRELLASGWWKVYGPLLLIPLASLRALAASLPGLFILGTASASPAMHGYTHYYPLLLVVFALYGMLDGYPKQAASRRLLLWRAALFIFPLCHAGWLTLSPPRPQLRADLAAAREWLESEASLRGRPICAQTIAFPHLGYKLALAPLSRECLGRTGALGLAMPAASPYPYTDEFIGSLCPPGRETADDGATIYRRFGGLCVFSGDPRLAFPESPS